ncbi:hypothetical protein [Muriicola sp. Z0-33]|uniref:hypothetical protein n=1 Tax=Muriicola sp. Z0-33 TaxID=2816957 RepID=UPI002238A794|nr:hypothetical protein [Muriicola sp. Z0-33]MCW5515095.1 hypothetical protein [Muriicola sp. Z0-33]
MKGLRRSLEEKPYLVVWAFSIIILCVGLVAFLTPEQTFDINIEDTYYVIALPNFLILVFLWFGLCGLGYYFLYFFKMKPIYWLTLIHLVLSILMAIPLCFPDGFTGADPDLSVSYYPEAIYFGKRNGVRKSSLMVLLSVQMLYIINIASSVLRKIRS